MATAPRRSGTGHSRAPARGALAAGAAAALALALAAGPAEAGKWRITPRISAQETFSDNIDLSPGGGRPDWVSEVRPGIDIRGTGRRIDLDLSYNLQALDYARGSRSFQLNHQLQAIGNAELYRQVLFLDFSASMRQENTANTGRLAGDTRSATGGTADVITGSLTPIVRHHFGRWADAEVRTTFSLVDNSGASGSKTRSLEARIDSGSRFARLPWSVTFSRRREHGDSGARSVFQRLQATVRYRISRRYELNLRAGTENNSFARRAGSSPSGLTWRAGAVWNPTPRTSIDLGFEDRFFGTAFSLDARHRSRRAVLTARYAEDTTTSSQIQLQRQLIPLTDAFGEPILDPDSGQAVLIPTDTPALSEEVIVRQRLDAGVTVKGRRSEASLKLFNDRRAFQLTGDSERTFGLSASASRRLSRLIGARLSGSWQRTKPRAGGPRETRFELGAGLSRQLSGSISLNLDLRHLRQISASASGDYSENRASASLSARF